MKSADGLQLRVRRRRSLLEWLPSWSLHCSFGIGTSASCNVQCQCGA